MPEVRKIVDPGLVDELVDAWSGLGRSHRKPERHASPRSVNSIALYDQMLDECLTSLNTDT